MQMCTGFYLISHTCKVIMIKVVIANKHKTAQSYVHIILMFLDDLYLSSWTKDHQIIKANILNLSFF